MSQKKRVPKKVIIISIVIVVAIAAVISIVSLIKNSMTARMLQAMPQESFAIIEKRSIRDSVTTTGTLISAQSEDIVSANTNITVLEINAEVGDIVRSGDVLVEFDMDELNRQLEDIDLKISETTKTESLDNTSKNREQNYDYITQNNSLVKAQEAANEALEALNKAQTDLADAKKTYEETKVVLGYREADERQAKANFEANSASPKFQEDYSAAKTAAALQKQNVETYKAKVEALEETVKRNQKTYDDSLYNYNETTRSVVNKLAGTAEQNAKTSITAGDSVASLKRQREDILKKIDACTITAPFDGIVTAITADEGAKYAAGPILTLQNCDLYRISASVGEYDVPDISAGMKVIAKTEATGDVELEGKVSYVAPTGSASGSGTSGSNYEIKVDLPTFNERLRLGMTAKLNIVKLESIDVLSLPYTAIQTDENGDTYIEVSKSPVGFAPGAIKSDANADAVSPPEGRDFAPDKAADRQTRPSVTYEKVYVTTGVDGGYYVEVIGEGLSEGMSVRIPNAELDGSTSQMTGNGRRGGRVMVGSALPITMGGVNG